MHMVACGRVCSCVQENFCCSNVAMDRSKVQSRLISETPRELPIYIHQMMVTAHERAILEGPRVYRCTQAQEQLDDVMISEHG